MQTVLESAIQTTDPNPFPSNGVVPAHCTSLISGTRERRWENFEGYTFDENATLAVLAFFAGLKHTQGPLAGEPFELSVEQRWLLREAFGWVDSRGARKFNIIFVEMGRGNGKSQFGAGLAGYLLLADKEMNPEVIGVAYTRDQARKYCLNRLRDMIKISPSLMSHVDLYKTEIRRRESSKWGGSYEAVASQVESSWGGAPHGVVFDEVHTQKNRELWDAMETATGKRRQAMMWGFTTAGWDRGSICYELHSKTKDISEGNYNEEEFLGIVWAASEEADWTDPEVWRDANPLLEDVEGSGLTRSGAPCAISISFMREKCKKAQNTPAFQNTFRTMYLSQWVGQETAFMDMATWDRNDHTTPLPPPAKRLGFGALDLSSTTDLSGFGIATRNGEKVELHLMLYTPSFGIVERERRDRLPYRQWAERGWLKVCEGETIDQDMIKADVFQAMEMWDLKDVAYDRWNASKLVRELKEAGVTVVEFGQGYASMSAPTKDFLKLATEGKFMDGGNGALRAMLANTSALTDAADNIKPDKSKSSSRIDGVVCSIMALDGLNRRGAVKKKSAYEDDDSEEGQEEEETLDTTEESPTGTYSYRRSAYDYDDDDTED